MVLDLAGYTEGAQNYFEQAIAISDLHDKVTNAKSMPS